MGRTTATILFTDLVGSTELRGRLGEEAAEELRRRHDRVLAQAVEANGGRVVKGLGDGIMASFTGASDAVAAAVAIQQAIDRLNRSGKTAVPLAVRVGLSAGDVTFEDDDVHGTPVIEASRLCAAAPGDEILAADVVRILAGSTGGHDYVSVGPVELKGLQDAVVTVRVEWEPAAVSTIPLPGLLTGVGRIFVGRDDEFERLGRLRKETAAGERRVALLAGEPGIGKTRLAAQLAQTAHADGTLVLAGRCDEDLGVPYQPFVEALRHYIGHAAEFRLGRHPGELVRLVPELTDAMSDLPAPLRSDPETERYRLFDAVAGWLADVSTETPVLLVLDDLHWAAKPTLLLLHHVLRFAEPLRLLVVVTYRDSEVGRGHPLAALLADLRRVEGVERFPLTGLDQADVAAFIEAAAGHRLAEGDEALPRAVWTETEGNPFFVAEVLRHLAESGGIERTEGGWVMTAPVEELGIPEGVRDVVGRRLSRLAAGIDRVLAVAAVVGLEFDSAVVSVAGGVEEDELCTALEEAVAARLLSPVSGNRFRFPHALVRATLYDELSGPRRLTLHRRVAEALEALHAGDLDDYLPALAHHWARAAAPAAESARAVDYAARAGDRALAQLAHDEAATYYAQALELLTTTEGHPDDTRRLELLLGLGEAQRRAGDGAYRETLLVAAQLAQECGDANALAQASLANSRGNLYSAIAKLDTERVAALESAILAVGHDQPALRARLMANLGLELVWMPDRQRRVELSNEALTAAQRIGDPATLAHVLLARDYTIAVPDNVRERLANTETLLELADVLGDPVVACRAWHLRFRSAMELADIVEAERSLATNKALVVDLAQPALMWAMRLQEAGIALLRGQLHTAEEHMVAAYETGMATGQPDAPVFLLAQEISLAFEQGCLADVEERVLQLLEATGLPTVKAMYGLLLLESDRGRDARLIFEDLADSGFAAPFDFLWLRYMTDCAFLCAHLQDVPRAARLYSLLEPYGDLVVIIAQGGVMSGSVAHYLGMLATVTGSFEEADARFAAAVTTHQRIGARTWVARSRLEWAHMLLTRRRAGDTDRARELLGQALATARERGFANVERRAVALLQERP